MSARNDTCADCGAAVGQGHGPADGWQLEDGRTVCQACCIADLDRLCIRLGELRAEEAENHPPNQKEMTK